MYCDPRDPGRIGPTPWKLNTRANMYGKRYKGSLKRPLLLSSPTMSPESARLFMVSGITFLTGIGGGAIAMNAIHGGGEPEVDPSKPRPANCAPCPQCPACPPPVDCGELGVVPPGGGEEEVDDDVEVPPSETDKPGLPASALPLAMNAVRDAIKTCQLEATSLSGVVLLDLVATTTAGGGFISEATITQATGDMRGAPVAECVRIEAMRARFTWEGSEGELKFKMPVKVGY